MKRRSLLTQRRPLVEALEDRCLLSFSPAVSYFAGAGPQAVLMADFNGDSRLDLAVANYDSSSVSALLGNADGTFQPAVSSATGGNPLSLAIGDFNADGMLDLATANAGDVSILLGNGDGAFQAPTSMGDYGNPTSVAVGDFNDDGNVDLGVTSNVFYAGTPGYWGWEYYPATPDYYEGYANVLLGNGDGSFREPNIIVLGSGFRTAATVRDFNNDGFQDFASANADNGAVSVLFGDGTGALAAQMDFGVGYYPGAVAAGDVNGDGNIDLATANYSDVSVLLGDGLGAFAPAQNYAVGTFHSSVAMADFNADGKLDLVTTNLYGHNVSVLLGNGDGVFQLARIFADNANPRSVAVGDFNGDLSPDVAAANTGSNDVSVLLNDGIWLPAISIGDATVLEGNTGTVSATFTVSLATASDAPVTVDYATADGSATLAGGDYQSASGTLIFAPGETSKTITVLVNGEWLYEPYECFFVYLNNPTNAVITDDFGTGSILNDDAFPPYLIISDVSVTEGNTGPINATFTLSLSAAYGQPVTVHYQTAAGNAAAGSDYTAISGDVTFAIGESSRTITIAVLGDRSVEPTENFVVNLSAPTNATIADGQGVGNILDDEPRININDVTVTEGNVGSVNRTFTVRLSALYDVPVTVHYQTENGSAAAGSDYTAAAGDVTIAAGQATKTFTVAVLGDRSVESTENFFVNLSGATDGLIVDSQGVGAILDNEPRISINDVTVTEGNSGSVNATFTVCMTTAYDVPVTIHYQTANGSATAGSDYTAAAGDVTIAAGQTSKTILVAVLGDRSGELTEDFAVNLSAPNYGLIVDSQGVGVILDNEPQIAINDVSINEGNTGTVYASVTISLSFAYDASVTVHYQTANGSATAGSDYNAVSGNLTFPRGVTVRSISIPVIGDRVLESHETLFVNLSSAPNALITDSQGLVTIVDDEPHLGIEDVSGLERNAGTSPFAFTVRLLTASSTPVTVTYATQNGTAIAGADYLAASGTLTFAPGETSKAITVQVFGDTAPEADETFLVNLSGATNALIDDGQAVGTIRADDLRVFNWDGGGGDFNWNNRFNWDTDGLPASPLDDVVIGPAFSGITVNYGAGTTLIHSLNSRANLALSGGSLTFIAASSINGDLTVSGGSLEVGKYLYGEGELTITGKFTNSGSVDARAIIHVYGDYLQTSTGYLAVIIGNLFDSAWGGLHIDGTARLAGALGVFVNYGSTYSVLTFGARIGEFASLYSNGLACGAHYEENALHVWIDLGDEGW